MTTDTKPRRVSRKREVAVPEVAVPDEDLPQSPADTVAAEDEEESAVPPNLAHPLRRLYAFAIDMGLWLAVVYMVAPLADGRIFSPTSAAIDIFAFFAYFVLLTGIFGRTLGKWVAGIKVVGADGQTPGVALAIPREMAGRFVSIVVAGVGLVWIVFDANRQGWHDKLAGTYVVNDGAAGPSFLSRFFYPDESSDDSRKRTQRVDSKVGSRGAPRRRRKRRQGGRTR